MASQTRNIRPAPIVDQAVARNGGGKGFSHRIAQISDRYSAILTDAQIDLTDAEMDLIRDALNGWWPEPAEHIAHLGIEIADAIALDGLDAKWGVDGPALLARIEAMSLAQKTRLVEDVEAWWTAQSDARSA